MGSEIRMQVLSVLMNPNNKFRITTELKSPVKNNSQTFVPAMKIILWIYKLIN